jgi:flagellar basal-body rod protein FlgF
MDTRAYVGLSGQLALEKRLATIANNVANAGTAGFRAEGVHFATVVSSTAPFKTSFATEGSQFADMRSGAMVQTGNALDVAIHGPGHFAIQTPAGVGYTRDGRMQVLPSGDLVTLNGHAILDVSGSPLTIDPSAGPIQIGRDGSIMQGGRASGAIGLFSVDLAAGYARYENAAFFPQATPEPVEDFARNGILQGYSEESNVNPILEMTHLINVSRAFEAVSSGMERSDQLQRDAIQALGGRS